MWYLIDCSFDPPMIVDKGSHKDVESTLHALDNERCYRIVSENELLKLENYGKI